MTISSIQRSTVPNPSSAPKPKEPALSSASTDRSPIWHSGKSAGPGFAYLAYVTVLSPIPLAQGLSGIFGVNSVRSRPTNPIAYLDPTPENLPAFLDALRTGASTGIRTEAVMALRRMTPKPVETIPTLLKYLNDPDPLVRSAVSAALNSFEVADLAPYQDAFFASLADPDWSVSWSVSYSVTRFGPEAIARVMEILKSENPTVRRNALLALTMVRKLDQSIAPQIYPLLQDPDLDVRQIALRVLYTIEAKGDEAARQYLAILDGGEERLREGCSTALTTVGDETLRQVVIPALLERVRPGVEPSVRQVAAKTLGRIRTPAAFAVLTDLLDDADPAFRNEVRKTLDAVLTDYRRWSSGQQRAVRQSIEERKSLWLERLARTEDPWPVRDLAEAALRTIETRDLSPILDRYRLERALKK